MKYWEFIDGNLVVGQEIEGGGWYVTIPDPFVLGDVYELFEVPQHGGEPHSVDVFESFSDAYEEAMKLT